MTATMTIGEIVEQALRNGYLTPTMEAEVGRICDNASELAVEEYQSLDRLMGALLTGQVVAVPRKQFINVMEELVLTEAITSVSKIEATSNHTLDLGRYCGLCPQSIATPLCHNGRRAQTYQRQRARQELLDLIIQQVETAISRNLDQPDFYPDRHALESDHQKDLLGQVSSLLQAYAPDYEQPVKS